MVSRGRNGQLVGELHPFPHPAPAAQWRAVRLELAGLPGCWPGEIVTNATFQGWLLPRFAPPVAARLAADLAAAELLPGGVTRVTLTDTADTGDPHPVGVDGDGCYRIGTGWPWVSPDLLPDGRQAPYTGPWPSGIDPAELPAHGQDTFTGMGCLMWLATGGDLVVRSVYPGGEFAATGGFDPTDVAGLPEYGNLDPDAEWRFRAVEHALRRAATDQVTVTGWVAAFTAAEIEALVATAAEAVCLGVEGLGARQLDLARRAHALLTRDEDDDAR